MNKNQLAKLNVQIKSLEREIDRLTTQFSGATGVNKTKLANKIGPLKTRLTKLKNQYDDGKKKDDQSTAETGIKKTTKENEALEEIKTTKTGELETKKKEDVKKKNFKTTFEAVAAMYGNMAGAPTQKDLDGLKSELDGLIPDLQTAHLRKLYRDRVDKRYNQRSEEFRKKAEAEKQGKIDKKNYKTTLDAVVVMFANMAKAPTLKDLDGLKSELDGLIPDLATEHLRNLYRSRVDERYRKRSTEFEKVRMAKEEKSAEDVFSNILSMPLAELKELYANEDRDWLPSQKARLREEIEKREKAWSTKDKEFADNIPGASDAQLQEMLNHPETNEEQKALIQAEIDKRYETGQTEIIEGRPADEDEGTFQINEDGLMEVVKDGKWVLYTGPYTKGGGTTVDEDGISVQHSGTIVEYVNGVAVDGPERVADSEEFGTEWQQKLDADLEVLLAANESLRGEITSLIQGIKGDIGRMDTAKTIEELDIIRDEINGLIDSILSKAQGGV